MKLKTVESEDAIRILFTSRILITPDHIEFMNQGATLSKAIDDEETVVELTQPKAPDNAFLMSSLDEAWNRIVTVPIGPPADFQGRLIDGTTVLDLVPDEISANPDPRATGPTIEITVGQAILGLAAFADYLRAAGDTVPLPPEP